MAAFYPRPSHLAFTWDTGFNLYSHGPGHSETRERKCLYGNGTKRQRGKARQLQVQQSRAFLSPEGKLIPKIIYHKHALGWVAKSCLNHGRGRERPGKMKQNNELLSWRETRGMYAFGVTDPQGGDTSNGGSGGVKMLWYTSKPQPQGRWVRRSTEGTSGYPEPGLLSINVKCTGLSLEVPVFMVASSVLDASTAVLFWGFWGPAGAVFEPGTSPPLRACCGGIAHFGDLGALQGRFWR
ncbi:hypothetical protein K438DRAFT_1778581 [Mycena galopus ATCC 62051]|nr:hypothetical protein K438DRAFT_1778581 [Mycena galopus ATCC 62051]